MHPFVHRRAPWPLVLLSMLAFPLAYTVLWHLHARWGRPAGEPRRFARFFFFLNFYTSDFLQIFNPFALAGVLAQLLAMLVRREDPRRADPVKLRWPLHGTWLVGNGGPTRATSHSWTILAQRYAYDFVVGPSPGHMTDNVGGRRLADYPAFGQPILAPVGGRVAAVKNTVRDSAHPGSGWLDWWGSDPRGNHVLIECQPGTFVLLAHLRRHSITLEVGQIVQTGAQVGECGNSGRSTEPHLHLHCQRGAGFAFATGVPIVFSGATIRPTDEQPSEEGFVLQRGMQVTSTECGLERRAGFTPPSSPRPPSTCSCKGRRL